MDETSNLKLMNKAYKTTSFVLICLCLAACGSAPSITDMTWQVISIAGTSIPFDTTQPRQPQFRFQLDSNLVMGFGGCNMFSGPYTQKGDSVRFGPLVTTKMACSGMELEYKIYRAFDAIRTVKRADERLLFMAGDSVVLECKGYTLPFIDPEKQ